MIKYTNEAILEGLKSGDRELILNLYQEFFPVIKFMIMINSGDETDAEDIFQDALVIIFQRISSDDLILTSSFKTFLYSICRNLWLQRLEARSYNSDFLDVERLDSLQQILQFDIEEKENEKFQLYQKHFLKLGKDCQKLLRLFINKMPLEEIAYIMDYKSGGYAKTRKFMCKERLKNNILNDPECKQFFE